MPLGIFYVEQNNLGLDTAGRFTEAVVISRHKTAAEEAVIETAEAFGAELDPECLLTINLGICSPGFNPDCVTPRWKVGESLVMTFSEGVEKL